jgi:hypothetical protein
MDDARVAMIATPQEVLIWRFDPNTILTIC